MSRRHAAIIFFYKYVLNMRINTFTIPFIFMAALSCQNPAQDPADGGEGIHGTDATVTVDFRFGDDLSDFGTRSSVSADESEIKDINIYAYRDGRLEGSVYSHGGGRSEMTLLSGNTYRFYAMANTGEVEAPLDEQDLLTYRFSLDDIMMVELDGFPMSGLTEVAIGKGNTTVEIILRRLVAKVRLKVDVTDLPGFTVRSVRLMNTPKDVAPFAENSAASETLSGDYATNSDIAAINSGKSAYFYMLENCQGVLLPGNNDPWKKVPENIPGGKAGLCTYMEVEAELDGSSGLQGPVTYRFYLGQDVTSDFSIFRNTDNIITLIATEEGINRVSWKISNGELTPICEPVVVACSDGILLYTESDGGLTRARVGTGDWYDVIHAGGRYVAVGASGSVALSSDGVIWTKKSAGTADLHSVTYGNGVYVAVGESGAVARSTNGSSWTVSSTGSSTWESVAYGNGMFVAVGSKDNYSGSVAWSNDGNAWSSKSGTLYRSVCNSVTFGDGRFVAVGASSTYTGTAGYSTDGQTWHTDTKVGAVQHEAIAYGNGMFIGIGMNESIISTDGVEWEMGFYPMMSVCRDICASGKTFVTAGNSSSVGSPRIFFSVNGSDWISPDLSGLENNVKINGVCFMK